MVKSLVKDYGSKPFRSIDAWYMKPGSRSWCRINGVHTVFRETIYPSSKISLRL